MMAIRLTSLILGNRILHVSALTKIGVMEKIPHPTVPSNFSLSIGPTRSEDGCQLLCLQTAGCELAIFDDQSRTCQSGNLRDWNRLEAPTPVTISSSKVYFNTGIYLLENLTFRGSSMP